MDLMVKFQLTDLSGISSARYGSFLGIFTTLLSNTSFYFADSFEIVTLPSKSKHLLYFRGEQMFQTCGCLLQILDAMRVTSSKFHPENS
jgi:hypothetical protein